MKSKKECFKRYNIGAIRYKNINYVEPPVVNRYSRGYSYGGNSERISADSKVLSAISISKKDTPLQLAYWLT